jgi:cysteine desulfuration protein SufE
MTAALSKIVDTFASVDVELRLELLLDYARKLPPLPQRLRAQRDAGLNRVDECVTPVFLWVEKAGDALRLFVDVAEESPTIRGLLSIIVLACDGAAPEEIAALPADLLNRLGLQGSLRMNRAVGFSAIIGRIKREAAEAASASGVRA